MLHSIRFVKTVGEDLPLLFEGFPKTSWDTVDVYSIGDDVVKKQGPCGVGCATGWSVPDPCGYYGIKCATAIWSVRDTEWSCFPYKSSSLIL